MTCLVCGNPTTVQAHLVPRALIHDIRGEHPHVFELNRNDLGERYRQSGLWDKEILCEQHERMLQPYDDAGIRFIRNFERNATRLEGLSGWSVPNPNPKYLVKFAASLVWRHAVSKHLSGFDVALGPYEPKIRELIFGSADDFDPPLTILRKRYFLKETALDELLLPPFRTPGLSLRSWQFEIGGLSWIIKFDPRRQNSPVTKLAVNNSDPALVADFGELQITDHPGIMSLLANMSREDD